MKQAQLDKKLKELATTYKRSQLKRARECLADAKGDSREYYLKRSAEYATRADQAIKHCTTLSWGPKRGTFKGSNGKLTFDPISGEGRSYDWYSIAKVVKGVQLVNNYAYSVTTSGHASSIRSLLTELGIKFEIVEAPKGLQDLDQATNYHVIELERALLKESHKRTKVRSDRWYRGSQYHTKALKVLAKLGYKPTKAQLSNAKRGAEAERAAKLEANRNKVKFIEADDTLKGRAGLHIVRSHMPSKYGRHEIILEAQTKGFKKVYVHIMPDSDALQRVNAQMHIVGEIVGE